MFTTGILADIWNIVDFGIEPSLDLIQSVGAQSLSLRVTSSRVSQLRAGELDGPRIFRSEGGYFFQPDKSKYSNTRIKPVTASWLKSRDPLEQIAEGCKKRDLELRLRISALESPVIATRYPEAATKTVFGDVSPESLSASNPDVIELLRATAIDLSSRFSPSALELEELCFRSGDHWDDGFDMEFDYGEELYELLSISFDESSAQSAIAKGVDVDSASRWVKVALEKMLLNSERAGSRDLQPELENPPVLAAYLKSQIKDSTDLVAKIAEAVECPISMVLLGEGTHGQYPRPDCDAVAHDRGVILEYIFFDKGFEGDEGHFAGIEKLQPSFGARQIRLDVTCGGSSEGFIRCVKSHVNEGMGGVIVSAFGLVPPSCFDYVKKAFRYALREAR